METLFEDERLRITFEPGTEHDKAIVAFAGFALGFGGIQREEFAGTLSDASISHDVYYVVEKARSLFNETFETIRTVLDPRLPLGQTYLLGNSAGGYGALLFDTVFAARKSTIAFVPTFSVRPNGLIYDPRFRDHIEKIATWRFDHVPKSNGSRRFIFFGDRDTNDLPHLAHFRAFEDPNAQIYCVSGCGHDVAMYLQIVYRALRPIIDIIVNHDASHDDVSALLQKFGIPVTIT